MCVFSYSIIHFALFNIHIVYSLHVFICVVPDNFFQTALCVMICLLTSSLSSLRNMNLVIGNELMTQTSLVAAHIPYVLQVTVQKENVYF